ncbi:MAG: hypothetical protein FWH27_06600 [Planctomycetaceae bacterium]|nr:hypothetical protein [Planctomycetaceae bacterium]
MKKTQISLLVLFSVAVFFPLAGCSRQRYRHQADNEVNELLSAVARDKRWELVDYGLQPGPNSRFYDPYHPDCEPMPPDDATAHHYMHCVDGKRNGDWDENGHTQFIENPHWQQYLPFNDEGYVTLDKETAFQLAQIHSPEYQTALENLYLSALAVSAQRFQFDTQLFGGSSMFYSSNGAVRDSTWTNSNWVGFNKKLATGGQAVVELANSITWQLAGPDTQAYQTILSANFLQPFLRNGGREYVLESLTRSERNLLANVRQMAYYRQGFYKTVIFGGNNVTMPVANGSPTPSSIGSNLSGGYISLLASQIRIANQQNNVISNRDTEKQFIALFEAGRVRQYIQVEQARASYLSSQSQLMSQVNAYNSSVEQFVTSRLGLPPDLKVQIKDPLLQQFEIMSPELTAIQEGLETHYLVVRDKNQQIPNTLIDGLNSLYDRLKGEIANVYADIDKLEAKIPERISNIRFLEQETEQFEGYIDPVSFSEATFVERVAQLRKDVPKLENDLRMTFRLIENIRKISRQDLVTMLGMGRIDPDSMECIAALNMQNTLTSTRLPEDTSSRALTDAQQDPYRFFMTQVMRKLTGDVRQLSLEQARARLDAIAMTPIDITADTAIKVASQYRLDWMNARAELVNSWRDIEIAANELQSNLSFSVNGELGTRTNNPVAFDRRNGKINVGVEWDAPMTRLLERNAYRQAQINYQRARRNYYNFVDGVNRTLRDSLRNIDNVQFDFEVQRRAVLVAISRVHLAQLAMEEPPGVGQDSTSMSNTLARDLVEALNSLLSAQNQFMAIWVDHYGMRSALCLELGIMQLDENGIWLDPGSIREADYNQLVSRENENMGMTLPAAPILPGGNIPQQTPDVSDIEGMIYPLELRQAPPAPRLPVPSGILPTEAAPAPNAIPIRMTPSQMLSPAVEPSSSHEVLAPIAPQSLQEMPYPTTPGREVNTTPDSSDLQPAFPQRSPSEAILKNLGSEQTYHLPAVEETVDETSEYETNGIPANSVSTTMPNTSLSVAWHTAPVGTGQTVQTDSAPISVAVATSQSLPVPYSPNQNVPSIEQVGYRRSIKTDNTVTTTAIKQDKTVVYINNVP